MKSLSNQFLAGARFSPDQHRRVASGDPSDGLVNLLHRGALADDLVRGLWSLELHTQLLDLGRHVLVIEKPAHGEQDIIELEWLGYVVEGPQLDGLDG